VHGEYDDSYLLDCDLGCAGLGFCVGACESYVDESCSGDCECVTKDDCNASEHEGACSHSCDGLMDYERECMCFDPLMYPLVLVGSEALQMGCPVGWDVHGDPRKVSAPKKVDQ